MKRIEVREPDSAPIARADSYVVEVDWFPRLTEQQMFENAIARMHGKREPHENPNFIEVVVVRSSDRFRRAAERAAAIVKIALQSSEG